MVCQEVRKKSVALKKIFRRVYYKKDMNIFSFNKVFFVTTLFFGGVFSASAATTFPGSTYIVTTNTTFTAAGSPYILPFNFIVNPGVTLTLEPGAIVKTTGSIAVGGSLIANGTAENPVIFTSRHDDTAGGDSNGVNPLTGAPGQWKHIRPQTGGSITLRHTDIRYGGALDNLPGTIIADVPGTILIEDSNIYDSYYPLVNARNGNITIIRSTLSNSASEGIVGRNLAEITISNSTLKNIPGTVVYNENQNFYVDARNNYWGNTTGPSVLTPQNPGDPIISEYVYYEPFLNQDPTVGCQTNCFSNVLFLPGIMGSRLYESGEELWFSGNSDTQLRMEMNEDGTSKNAVYTLPDLKRELGETEETGIVDDTAGFNLYESFLNDLRDWKVEGVYNDYAFIPYDWRLSLNDIVMNGKVTDGQLSYRTANADIHQSFLYQQAKQLQQTSKSGKITLIGHSNGGLVIKAFVQKLKDINDPLYHQIDKIILVGVPQTGTPDAVISMLYGSRIGLPLYGVSPEVGRHLSRYMPTMYNLLPSEVLMQNLGAVIEFEGEGIPTSWTEKYGNTINSTSELEEFLQGEEGRPQPAYSDTSQPLVLDKDLLSTAKNVHQGLNLWTPAPETEVVQIAGWGMYTVSGLSLVTEKKCKPVPLGAAVSCDEYKGTTLVERVSYKGDATVLVESALAMNESAGVKKWWVDIFRYNNQEEGVLTKRKHKNIFEVDTLRPFIKCILQNTTCNNANDYISTIEPAPLDVPVTRYSIHSPLYLTVIDEDGNVTGYNPAAGEIEENIPGSQYFEVGEVKTIILPEGVKHTVTLKAYDEGSFTFSAEKMVGDEIVQTTQFEAVPTLDNSEVEVVQVDGKYTLQIDFEADNTPDAELNAEEGEAIDYSTTATVSSEIPKFYFDTVTKELVFSNAEHNEEQKTVTHTLDGHEYKLQYKLLIESPTRLHITFTTLTKDGERIPSFQPVGINFRFDQKKKNKPNLDITVTKARQKFTVDYQQKKNKTVVKNIQKKKVTSKKTYKGIVTTTFSLHNEDISWGVNR